MGLTLTMEREAEKLGTGDLNLQGVSLNSVPCFHRQLFNRVPVQRTFTLCSL